MNNTCIYVLIFVGFFSTYVVANLVPSICKDLSRNDQENVSYDYCVSKLGSDPKSAHSTAEQLAEISFRLTISKADDVFSTIQKVVNGSRIDQLVKYPLKICSVVYSRIPNDLKDGLVALKGGNYDKANVTVNAVVKIASICRDVVKVGSVSVSVLKENSDDFFKLGAISLGFTKLLRIIN
ncbi:hypothetical protein RND81_01G205300 [Saponaria officinalis]|uniref:Pectinesterase inhibitor domain-containing protein n=1 Tax=Saponaria officinalis TaxID=3572 RepID=A0AAW1NHP2_SAPOF